MKCGKLLKGLALVLGGAVLPITSVTCDPYYGFDFYRDDDFDDYYYDDYYVDVYYEDCFWWCF